VPLGRPKGGQRHGGAGGKRHKGRPVKPNRPAVGACEGVGVSLHRGFIGTVDVQHERREILPTKCGQRQGEVIGRSATTGGMAVYAVPIMQLAFTGVQCYNLLDNTEHATPSYRAYTRRATHFGQGGFAVTKAHLSGGQIGIRLSQQDRQKLELLASVLNCTPSAVVRLLLKRATPTKAAEFVFAGGGEVTEEQ